MNSEPAQRPAIPEMASTGCTGLDDILGAACTLLGNAGFLCEPGSDIDDLRRKLESGAGAAILAEESFFATDPGPLLDWVQSQPPWSDFPIIVLTARCGDPSLHKHTLDLVEKLRNVTLQERPVQTVTL